MNRIAAAGSLLGQGSRSSAESCQTPAMPCPRQPQPLRHPGETQKPLLSDSFAACWLNASAQTPRLGCRQLIHSSEILYKTSAAYESPFTSWPLTPWPSMNPDERPANESPLALPLKFLLGFLCPSSFSSHLLPISQEDKHRKNKPWDY